jgi:hypothetical protein
VKGLDEVVDGDGMAMGVGNGVVVSSRSEGGQCDLGMFMDNAHCLSCSRVCSSAVNGASSICAGCFSTSITGSCSSHLV